MVTTGSAYESKFFRADPDLKDPASGKWVERTLTIKSVEWTEYDNGDKARLIKFNEIDKGFGLNKTNHAAIGAYTGIPDDDDWAGVKVTLVMQMVSNKSGQLVPAVRIRNADKPDGAAPFGGIQPQQPQAPKPIQFINTTIFGIQSIEVNGKTATKIATSDGNFGTFSETMKIAATSLDGQDVELGYSTDPRLGKICERLRGLHPESKQGEVETPPANGPHQPIPEEDIPF